MFCGVFLCNFDSLFVDVDCDEIGFGEFFFDGDGDTAGAGADINDGRVIWQDGFWCFDSGEKRFAGEGKDHVDKLLGFGARSEDIRRNQKIATVKIH